MQPNNEQQESPIVTSEPSINLTTPIQPAPLEINPPNIQTQIVQPIKSKKTNKLLYLIGTLLMILAACGGAYYFGTKNSKQPATATVVQSNFKELTVPKDASVNEECVDGRGKQFILPKDIPTGPIYDVNNSKVVALEFLVKYSEIQDGAEKLINLKLNGAKYDHLMLMPVMPHAGQAEPHFHLIAFLISSEESKAIICKT